MDISLTDFVDFVTRAGTPKLTLVRNLKARPSYDPRTDYWKGLRDAILEFHANGSADPKALLEAAAIHATNHKGSLYSARVAAYRKFLRNKEVQWLDVPRALWTHNELSVRMNPELHLLLNGAPHVIKLYLKNEKAPKRTIDLVLYMMRVNLGTLVGAGTKMAVLDLPSDKLHVAGDELPNLMPLLKGEAAAFIEIWNGL